jgi:hypothetical protein
MRAARCPNPPSPAALPRADLSPQAGRGNKRRGFRPYSIGATIFGCFRVEASSFFGIVLLSV